MEQSLDFIAQGEYRKVCRLRKSLYGLKQSPRAWFDKFSPTVKKFGMKKYKSDHAMFYRQSTMNIILLVVCVDDTIIIENDILGISFLKSLC